MLSVPNKIDPLNVNVEFFLKDKEWWLRPLGSPGEGHLQRQPDRVATDQDKATFKPQFDAAVEQRDQLRTGTILTAVFKPEHTSQYYDIGIYNLEQLASISDTVIDQYPKMLDFKTDKKKAKEYLDYQHYHKEVGRRDETIAQQAYRIKNQEQYIIELEKSVKILQAKLLSHTKKRTEKDDI